MLEEIIRKHALKNAYTYGKASASHIIGKVIAEFPDAKRDMKGTMEKINAAISEINLLSKEEIEKEMRNYTYAEKREEKKKLTLPNAEMGKVVTRFPPEPSGFLHIGHAKAAFLDYEAAKVYSGKFLLRFDDTNPEKEKQEYVDGIKDELSWLGIRWDSETYTSDYLPKIYEYAEKIISQGDGYVCTCTEEEIKKNRATEKECGCREKSADENLSLWRKMLSGEFGEGEAIVRFKGDMHSPNTVMRDPTLLRIVLAPHYRQGKKYTVWPSYDFSVPILDALEKVTHAMRTKEYELRDELYFSILEKLKLPKVELVEFSRLQIKNAPMSKRLLIPLIEQKKVLGWDDPRLPTLSALRRRGILPEAIRNFVLSFGLSKVESEPTWDALLAENKKLIDPISPRYFFVNEPILLKVRNAPRKTAKIRKHPTKDLGFREIKTGAEFYIAKSDFESLLEEEIFRLKDLFNVRVLKKDAAGLEGEYAGEELLEKSKKIQWVPKDGIGCEVLIPHDLFLDKKFNEESLEIQKGLCEPECEKLEIGTIVQFERMYFARLDEKKEKFLRFIYAHR